MHQRTSWWAALAIGIAACSDPQAPTSPVSPELEPQPRLNLVATTTSNPRLIEGNISGNGTAVCAEVNGTNTPWLGQKVDGANGATIAGYVFSISGGGRYVSYQPAANTAPFHVITAVVVKGGPDTYVYSPTSAGTLMRAPDNAGGNVPQISHYTVCYTQGPGYTWQVQKTLTQVFSGTASSMTPLGTGQPVVIPQGQTRWLEFQITVTRSGGPGAGATATLQDLAAQACASLPAGFQCLLPNEYGGPGMVNYTYPTVTGSGTFHFMIDVVNTGAACGAGGTITNVAQLTPAGGSAQQSSVQVQVVAPGCYTLSKALTQVFSGTASSMTPLGTGQPVVIPQGQTRWLEFQITVTATGSVPSARLHDLAAQACAQLPAGFQCLLPNEYGGPGMVNYTYPGTITGSGTFHFMIDVVNTGAACGAQGTITNVARLTSGSSITSATLTADAPRTVTIRAQACT
jgi:hypothetical protein